MLWKTYRHFLLVYFLLGLSPYFTTFPPTRTTRHGRVLRYVPCCITVTISIGLLINTFVMNRTIFSLHGKINDFIAFFYFLTLIMSNISGNYQCIRYQTEYFSLMQRIFQNGRGAYLGSYKWGPARKTFVIKSILILVIYFVAVLVLFLQDTTIETIFFKVEISALEFVSSLNTLHAIMYIELVRSYLKTSGKFILQTSLCHNGMSNEERYFNLRSFKKIYFDWWNIVQKINIYFGWSLLALMIKCFVNISYISYYYFLTLQTDLDAAQTLHLSTSLLLPIITITIPINSCHYCSTEVSRLVEIIERYTFWTANTNLYQIKCELFHQIHHFPIRIIVKGFLTMDRRLLIVIVSGCCTYVIIFIQFHLAVSPASTPPETIAT